MRELKFRAWHTRDTDSPIMNYAPFICCSDGVLNGSDSTTILMQYTGLKDNKRTKEFPEGQQIFEGDVVRMRYEWISNNPEDEIGADKGYYVGVVSMLPSLGVVMRNVKKYSEYEEDPEQLIGYRHVRSVRSTIIGNIYENPELLTA